MNFEESGFEGISLKKKVIVGLTVVFIFFTLIFIGKIIENVAADEIVINQVPITGTLEFWTTPGWKLQGFGDVTKYDKSFQMWFSEKDTQGNSSDESIKIVFNDAGMGWISGSARLVMPKDKKNLALIKTEFGTMTNLLHELVEPTVTKVVFSSGPLMSSFESYAVKKNDLIRYIEDQLRHGIYRTISKEVQKIDELSGKKKTVTIAEPITGKEFPGGFARQEEAPLTKYGIEIRAVSVENIRYEDKIMDQISTQQKAFMDVQTSIAEAKKAKQEAIKAEENGKAEYQKAKWEQEKINAKEIAEAEKGKTVAKLDMEKAKFQKQADILSGQGKAEKKRLAMKADGALSQKLDAYIKVNQMYAESIAKYQGAWVPTTVIGGGNNKKGNYNGAQDLINMLMIKTAKDLSLDKDVQ